MYKILNSRQHSAYKLSGETWQMTERLGFRIYGTLYRSSEDALSDNDNEEDTRFFKITPSLYYEITENHYLELAYSYSNEYNDDKEPSELDRNSVWLSITFKFPKKW